MNIVIVGLGRIGRTILRQSIALGCEYNIVLVDKYNNPENIAYLLKYDSMRGSLLQSVSCDKNLINIGNSAYKYFSWEEFCEDASSFDVVIDSTGVDDVLNSLIEKYSSEKTILPQWHR